MKASFGKKVLLGFCILMLMVVSDTFAQTTKEKAEKKIESKIKINLEGLEGLEALGGLEDIQGVEAFEMFHHFEEFQRGGRLTDEEQLKLESLRSLVEMDENKALPALKNSLKKEKNPKIRKRLVRYLARIDDPEVIVILGNLAKNDPDPEVRKRAIYYLGKSGDKRAVKILKDILQE